MTEESLDKYYVCGFWQDHQEDTGCKAVATIKLCIIFAGHQKKALRWSITIILWGEKHTEASLSYLPWLITALILNVLMTNVQKQLV